MLNILTLSNDVAVIKSHLKCHINRILHLSSFHIKLIKVAEGSFKKFHMK